MKPIINPPRPNAGYNCYGCAPNNPIGLHMQFFEEGDFIIGIFKPSRDFQSYENILHGGVQMAVLDEVACWVIMVKAGTAGYTQSMRFEFLKHVYVHHGPIKARGRLASLEKERAVVELEILDEEDVVRTRGIAEYFVVSERIARRLMQYPGSDAFRR